MNAFPSSGRVKRYLHFSCSPASPSETESGNGLKMTKQANEKGVIKEYDTDETHFLKISLAVPSRPSKSSEFIADVELGELPVADLDVEFDISPEEEAAEITLKLAEDDIKIMPTSLRKSVTVEGERHYRLIPEEFEDLLILVTYELG